MGGVAHGHPPRRIRRAGCRHDRPQLVENDRRWYLLYLQRNTRYRIAAGPQGPLARPLTRDLGTMYAAAGSRPVCDGRRWISFPFVVGMEHQRDLGDWQYGGPLAVPRELHFTPGDDIHERPLAELVATLNLLPALSSELQGPRPLVGHWDTSEAGVVVCRSDAGGTLLLPNLPGNLYLKAEVVLPAREMEAHLILRAAEDLSAGYKLALHRDRQTVDVRHISGGDVNRVLVSRHLPLPVGKPMQLRVFLAGSVLDAFIDGRASITTRVYERRQGALALEFRDAPGQFRNLRLRQLQALAG